MSNRKHKDWMMSEVRYLQDNRQLPDDVIAGALERTIGSIQGARKRYNILKGGDGRLKPGHKPWNKGKSYTANGSEKTWFKKGHLPHNTKEDHAISIRYHVKGYHYKYIRLSKGIWVLLHRHIWEAVNGQIPKGYNVCFKDKNTLNCNIENLELVSRQENMRRNQNREKASEKMKKVWNYQRTLSCFGIETPFFKKLRIAQIKNYS